MIITTTPTIEGHPIREYKGLVTGETIIGANFVKDFFAGIRDIVGGRSGAYERVLREAKDTALKEMEEHARAIGANAIVGIDLDYEALGANSSMLMVTASGTAVVITPALLLLICLALCRKKRNFAQNNRNKTN